MLIIGQGALARDDGAAILALARDIAERFAMVREGWNGFNVLHIAAGRVGGLELGFVPGARGRDVASMLEACKGGAMDVLYLLGADEIAMPPAGAFVVYQGHHGDAGAHRADAILPGAAYTEKDATYVNTEGRVQRTRRAVFPPGEAREDWKIPRALSEMTGGALPYDSLAALRRAIATEAPALANPGDVAAAPWGAFGTAGPVDPRAFVSPVANYYMTDPISRASETMAKCTASARSASRGRTGTDG
jgi:NADH-quinone oxidoreductase subunit G